MNCREMLASARAMQAGLAGTSIQSAGRVAVGTVKGDLHDIGKNLVTMMLEGAQGGKMILGRDLFVQARFVYSLSQ
jgi:5-methyltetrahydrofolate--homocysteine methyltransferase